MRQSNKKASIFDIFNIMFLLLVTIIIIVPIIFIINQSFMTTEGITKYGYVLIPRQLDFSTYRFLLQPKFNILTGFQVSIFVTLVGTFLNLIFTSTLAYGLSKKYLPYRTQITMYVFITMLFGGGLLPTYILVTSLGMRNSLWALIIPGLVSSWNMLIMRNFFMAIPESLEESARIDGANDATILTRIILPVSLPVIATIGLFYAVGHWNSWFPAAIYIRDPNKKPLQLILRDLVLIHGINLDASLYGRDDIEVPPTESFKAAVIVVTTLPIIFVYPFIQKYFVKGVMIGSIKG